MAGTSKSKTSARFNSPVGFLIWSNLEKPKNTETDDNKPERLRYEMNIAFKKTPANKKKLDGLKAFCDKFVKEEGIKLSAKKKKEMWENLIMDGDARYDEKLEEVDGDKEKLTGYERIRGCWIIRGRSSYVIPGKDEKGNEYRDTVPEKIFYNGMICQAVYHLYSSDSSGQMGVYSSADGIKKLSDAERISSVGIDLDSAFEETSDDDLSEYQHLIDAANDTDVAVSDHTPEPAKDLDEEPTETATEGYAGTETASETDEVDTGGLF
jgi:hypothetical protein